MTKTATVVTDLPVSKLSKLNLKYVAVGLAAAAVGAAVVGFRDHFAVKVEEVATEDVKD